MLFHLVQQPTTLHPWILGQNTQENTTVTTSPGAQGLHFATPACRSVVANAQGEVGIGGVSVDNFGHPRTSNNQNDSHVFRNEVGESSKDRSFWDHVDKTGPRTSWVYAFFFLAKEFPSDLVSSLEPKITQVA